MMEELQRVRKAARPHSVLLVLDVVTGQNAVEVAQAFQEYADFDGMVLTKLDGDARGGVALSVVSVTGRPVKFASERSEEHSLNSSHANISYAVFCLKKNNREAAHAFAPL